jgi:hypothetical protein
VACLQDHKEAAGQRRGWAEPQHTARWKPARSKQWNVNADMLSSAHHIPMKTRTITRDRSTVRWMIDIDIDIEFRLTMHVASELTRREVAQWRSMSCPKAPSTSSRSCMLRIDSRTQSHCLIISSDSSRTKSAFDNHLSSHSVSAS